MSAAIRFEAVSKRYRVVHQRPFLAKQVLRMLLQRPSTTREFWALKDIGFSIGSGESIGVIGDNGSGKSTLLALIARTSYPTRGTVSVEGRVGPLLELGAGFHPDLTGHENIYLNAALMGLSREQVEDRFADIVAFSGLGDFIDAPINTYSSGMKARLGFAVVAHVDPEILLLDEVMSVGDAGFQVKCEQAIDGFRARGVTIFFVSHTLSLVEKLCSRSLWIHRGKLSADGPSGEVIQAYQDYLSHGGA